MIRLKLHNGELDLSPNTVVPWRTINPFFEEEEEFSPQFSLPFTLPKTANNQILLQYADQLQVSSYDKSFSCIMYYGGVLFFRGMLNILKAGSNGYQVSLSFDKTIMDTSRSLRDYTYGGARVGESDAVVRDANNALFYPSVDYVWPLINNTEEKKNEKYNGSDLMINDYHGALMMYDNTELATPTPFLNYVIKQAFKEMGGIDAIGTFFDEVADKVIYNPVVTNTMVNESLKISTIWNVNRHQFDNVHKEMEIRITDAATTYNVAVGAVISMEFYQYPAASFFPTTLRTLNYTVQITDVGNPQQLLQHIWAAIQALSGAFALRDQNWADPDNPWFIFSNASREDFLQEARSYQIAINYTPAGVYLYNDPLINKHLPDIKFRDVINIIKDGCNLTIFFNTATNTIIFTPRKNQILTNKYKDYTSKLIQGFEKEVLETKDYRFVFQNDTTDLNTADESTWYATNHAEYNSKNVTEFKVALAAPKMPPFFSWPQVKQGLFKYSDTETPDFTLRLMSWKGMVNITGTFYPIANTDGLTPDEMYDTWFKDWYRLTKNGRDLADFDIALDINDLLKFDPELKWKVLHNNYIWKEIETNLTMTGIEPSRVRLLALPAMANIYNSADGEALPPE